MYVGATCASLLAGSAQGRPAGVHCTVRIGVELPFAGRDGADGLQAREAIALALDGKGARGCSIRVVYRDSARHIQNPHEDEARDPVDEPERAAAIIRAFGRDPAIVAVIGGLHPDVARADAAAARPNGLAVISGASVSGDGRTLFTPRPGLFAGDTRLRTLFMRRYIEAPSAVALRFYGAARILADALYRTRPARRAVRANLAAACPGGTCPLRGR